MAPYTVYKGKAALSVAPILPTFTKLDVWPLHSFPSAISFFSYELM